MRQEAHECAGETFIVNGAQKKEEPKTTNTCKSVQRRRLEGDGHESSACTTHRQTSERSKQARKKVNARDAAKVHSIVSSGSLMFSKRKRACEIFKNAYHDDGAK